MTLRLEQAWTGQWHFGLVNEGAAALAGFTLCWNGHCKVDPAAGIEHARLVRRVSNFTEVAPPEGFVLRPGAAWRFVIGGVNVPLRHWTEAARAAYVVLPGGATMDVTVGLCGGGEAGEPILGAVDLGEGRIEQGLALVPWPAHVAVAGSRAVPDGFVLPDAAADFIDLFQRLFHGEAFADPAGPVLRRAVRSGPGYSLGFGAELTIAAADAEGFFQGLVTLGQVLRAARHDPRCRFPASGEIADAPRFDWRGLHLDVARQFYAMAELEHLLAVMAWLKLNRFHLHLTDDEAWRFEVKAYPALTDIGAWRGHGLPIPPLLGSGAAARGGFYTQDDLRRLVALAAGWGIEIIPEIDVPGHCFAALAALPGLRDAGETGICWSVQAFPDNALNPAVPAVMEFVELVFDEVLDVFPGRFIHVGGDEVPVEAWASSPLAAGRDAAALQASLLRHLHARLRRAGRITAAWEEAAPGIGPDAAVLMAWQDHAAAVRLAAEGYNVIVALAQVWYLNMALAPDWWEPGASWAGYSPVAAAYGFEPGTGFADPARLAGVQACIWSEQMADRRVFARLVFPRLAAVAEAGWTAPGAKEFARFAAAARLLPVWPEGGG